MDQDGDSVGRTFWTIWQFITEAVNRFLHQVPTTIGSNDPTVVNSEPADSGHTENDASEGGVDEKLPLAPVSLRKSSGIVGWDTGSGQDEQHTWCKIHLSGDTESKASEAQESKREELFCQTGNDDGGHSRAEKCEEGEEKIIGKVVTPENDEDEEEAKMGPLTLTDDAGTQDVKGSSSKDSSQQETQRTMASNSGTEKMDESMTQGEDNEIQREDKLVTEKEDVTDYDAKEERVLEASPEHEGEKHGDRVSTCKQLSENDTDVKGDANVEQTVARRSERDKDEDEGDKEEESVWRDEEQCEEENMTEPANNQPEQEDGVQTVTEVREVKDILTEQVPYSGDVTPNAKAELQPAEEQEDVAKLTKTRQTGCVNVLIIINENPYVATTDVLVDEVCLKKAQVEDERQSSEEDNNVEIACAATTVTVKLETEAAQETSGELENIPLRMCEGQVVVSPGPNSPACEETQEGVPEYNNEPGPDENTSQKFLEVEDCDEIQTTQLPEEVESLQNSGCTTAAAQSCLLVKEDGEEEQESARDTGKELVDAGLAQNRMKPLAEHVIQELGLLFENKEGTILVHSMKMEIEDSEKEFEANILADEAIETQELRGNTEELAEVERDERLSDSRDAAGESRDRTGAVAAGEVFGFAHEPSKPLNTEVKKIMDVGVFQESVDIFNLDQSCNMLPSLIEDIAKSGSLKESVEREHTICRDHTVEMQDAVIDVEAAGHELEEEAAEDVEMQNLMEIFNPQLLDFAAEPITEDKSQSAPTAESELDKAFEISAEEMFTNTEATDSRTAEVKSKDSTVAKPVTESEDSDAKEESSEHPYVIDEEILDLWIQAVSSEDKRKEEPEPEQQREDKIEQTQEEQAETSAEMERAQLVESSSGESGFLDRSLTSEWDTQPSEAQPLKSMSFKDDYSRQFESEFQDILMGEAAETEQSDQKEKESITEKGFYTDSGVVSPEARHQNQESYKSQEISDGDHSETETGSQEEPDAALTDLNMKIDWKDTEEEDDIESQTSGEKGEGMKLPRLESVKIMHDFTLNEYGRPKSGSELLLEEEIKFTQSNSQADTGQLFKLPSLEKVGPDCSEDFVEVLEHPTTKFEGPFEVEASSLDFTAQRSRIAVKNPRIRPPKDPRSLLHMPSLEPTPSSHLPVKVPAGVPLGVGIKLPGLAAGFPVLKKTQRVEPETKPEDTSDPPKQDEVQQKPKWMPPKHPGFGNPLMSELKTKLKKTTKE